MTKENAAQFLPLVQALADGKTIQHQSADSSPWIDLDGVAFDNPAKCYRIKPEPREWTLIKLDSGRIFNRDYFVGKEIEYEVIRVREILD